MTHMLRKHQNDVKSSTTLPIHRDSRVITKVQPKIRIIHIFAPEIIQTDVANFRELVQRLTGKPSPMTTTITTSTSSGSSLEKSTSSNSDANKARNKLAMSMKPQLMEPINNNSNNNNDYSGDHDQSYNYHYKPAINVNNKDSFGGYDDDHRDKYNGGFLEVFDGVNDHFMEMGDFSLAPNDNLQTHHQHLEHHMYEDTFHPLSYRG